MTKDKDKIIPEEAVEHKKDPTAKEKHRWDDDIFVSADDMKEISQSIKDGKLKIRN